MVSISTLMTMVVTILICFIIPIGLLWVVRRRYQASLVSFLVGMIAFVVVTQVLEAPLHLYFLKVNETTATYLSNPYLYALYGGVMAAIFEETGRLICFKYILKKHRRIQDGMSYGIGHGGIEAMLIVGTTYVSNLILSILINSNMLEQLGLSAEYEETIVTQLTQISPVIFGLAGYERFMTLIIQIGLSILVFKAVRERKIRYYGLAFLIHALLDFPAALYQVGLYNIYIVEGIVTLVAIAFLWFIWREFKTYKDDLSEPEDKDLQRYQKLRY